MLTSCKYCHRIHDSKHDCGMKLKKHKKNTNANNFRHTRRWREKRNKIVERDKHLCQVCLIDKIYNYNELEVHHITPIEEDYDKRLEDDNLITLCRVHHERAENGDIKREYLKGIIKDD